MEARDFLSERVYFYEPMFAAEKSSNKYLQNQMSMHKVPKQIFN